MDDQTTTIFTPDTPPQAVVPALHAARCPACGGVVAADQRYCLECGERSGRPRVPYMDGRTPPPRPPEAAPAAAAVAPRRTAAGPTLVAGIGTLLLAMGVGVLIGRSGNNDNVKAAAAPPVQVVTVAGAGGAAAASTATAATPAAAGSSSAKKSAKAAKAAAAATATAQRKPKAKLPPAVVKVGQKGHGKGYKNGKFTGDFFGP